MTNKSKPGYGAATALVAIDNSVVRKGLAEALRRAGFASVEEAASLEALGERLAGRTVDLVVAGSELGGKFLGGWVTDLRAGRLAHHPFPVVMIYLAQNAPEHVRKVIDCGPDDILLQPVVPGQLLSRLAALVERRKPFIVTHDYTGPDRRKEARPGSEQAPQLEAPNPLKLRRAKASPEAIAAAVQAGVEALGQLKLKAYAVQLRWLEATLGALVDQLAGDTVALQPHLVRLKWLCADLQKRLASPIDGRAPDAIEALATAVQTILRAGPAAEHARWVALPMLCAAAAAVIV